MAREAVSRQKSPRRATATKPARGEKAKEALTISALERGLAVLEVFSGKGTTLGNQELARLTKLPKATISRITNTLTKAGFLINNERLNTYELGGAAMSLGFAALSRVDIGRLTRPLLEELAKVVNANVCLGMRDRDHMLNLETCQGPGLIALQLAPGSRVPLITTAMGRAYLAALTDDGIDKVLTELEIKPVEKKKIAGKINEAQAMISDVGFCLSIGEWHRDINAAGAPIILPDGRILALNIGGPSFLMPEEQMRKKHGPAVAKTAEQIARTLGGRV
ncbi:MAG: IclR family transcriptional regulator [Sphingomonas sp.]|uniref:IclR family transcriptional regulator n=1 Tax=Sphingomonas sp. TaxID=28214 RepID=UPI0025EC61AA|nr:IclR family transcriptional regulator [Sphingomonas sp.]MBX3563507.1 IclR family transcriptional regulator [Sphingomonas sp.]